MNISKQQSQYYARSRKAKQDIKQEEDKKYRNVQNMSQRGIYVYTFKATND